MVMDGTSVIVCNEDGRALSRFEPTGMKHFRNDVHTPNMFLLFAFSLSDRTCVFVVVRMTRRTIRFSSSNRRKRATGMFTLPRAKYHQDVTEVISMHLSRLTSANVSKREKKNTTKDNTAKIEPLVRRCQVFEFAVLKANAHGRLGRAHGVNWYAAANLDPSGCCFASVGHDIAVVDNPERARTSVANEPSATAVVRCQTSVPAFSNVDVTK